ncbi:MAG TPA: DUF3048 domain-containing protein [Lachnospiraceae bacterium]|nr:DUF3048 domain-containing protein [Lachnospiraceae bacterium]
MRGDMKMGSKKLLILVAVLFVAAAALVITAVAHGPIDRKAEDPSSEMTKVSVTAPAEETESSEISDNLEESSQAEVEEVESSAIEETESSALEEAESYPYTDPLTGMGCSEDIASNRPVAAMLNTIGEALPQSGCSDADILIEIPEEGGITRIMGLFQDVSKVGSIGTIRSTRRYYSEIAIGMDAILCHAGGSEDGVSLLEDYGYATLNQFTHPDLYWRDQWRLENLAVEHSLYTSGANIQGAIDSGVINKTHYDGYSFPWTFTKDGTPQEGDSAVSLTAQFSSYKRTTFDYDQTSGDYAVYFFDGQPYLDANNGQQVHVENVLILQTTQYTYEDGVHQGFDLTSGSGYYACGGKMIPIYWSKGDPTAQFTFTKQDGSPLTMGEGKTYICLMDYSAPFGHE